MKKSPFKAPNNESAFLGIGEGKRKKAKAEAAAIQLAAQKKQAEVNSPVDLVKTEKAKETIISESKSNTATYYIIGVVVVALVIGLYFIIKARRK